MAQCKKCGAIIPDNREYCNKCMKEMAYPEGEGYLDNLLNQSEDYLDNLLHQSSDAEEIFANRPLVPDESAVTDERLDSMLAANSFVEEITQDELDNAFDFLISDSDSPVEEKTVQENKEVDDIDILEQIIDNFAYDENKAEETSEEYNYDSLIDEVLAQDNTSASEIKEDDEIASLLDTDFFSNLAMDDTPIIDKEFDIYDENSVIEPKKEESDLSKELDLGKELDLAASSDASDFVSPDDIEALLQSLGSELGDEVSFTMDSNEEKPETVIEDSQEDEEIYDNFFNKMKRLFMNKGEKTAIKKQSDIDFEEEELRNQLKIEKEERKKVKQELKKAKAEAKEAKQREKNKVKEEKRRERANRQIEVVIDEGKINKIGAGIIVILGIGIGTVIILGTNWFSYANTVNRAQKYYDQGQYNEAYTQIAGIELKEDDAHLYDELRIISKLYSEYEYYESAMEVDKRNDAIFHLIKGLRKYEANIDKAKEYEVDDVYEEIYKDIIGAFDKTFSINEDKALEMAAMSDNDVVKIINDYKKK